jgi:hypothetical protein
MRPKESRLAPSIGVLTIMGQPLSLQPRLF